jgi:hypothetical protein
MDPDRLLADFLAACSAARLASDRGDDAASELAQLDASGSLADLAAWLRMGGFVPDVRLAADGWQIAATAADRAKHAAQRYAHRRPGSPLADLQQLSRHIEQQLATEIGGAS